MTEYGLDQKFIKKFRVINSVVNANVENYLTIVGCKKTPPSIDSHSKKQLMILINLYVQSKTINKSELNEKVKNYISCVIRPRMTYCIGDLESSDEHKKVCSVIKILVNEKNMLMEISTNVLIFLKAISAKIGNRKTKTIKKNEFNTILKDLDDNLFSFSMYDEIFKLAN